MKRIFLFMCCSGMICTAFGQFPAPLRITTNKTTSLVFPVAIKHADRATKDILVQQVPGVDNILLVKAALACFPETNLTVITGDGHLYSFLVRYDEAAPTLVYRAPATATTTLEAIANSLLDNPAARHAAGVHNGKVKAQVTGIFIKDSLLFYQLRLTNRSPINYDIAALHCTVRDRVRGTRSTVQDLELPPLYLTGATTGIKAYSSKTMVLVLEKFTMPDQKAFYIEVWEKNGGRHLNLKIQNHALLQAHMLE